MDDVGADLPAQVSDAMATKATGGRVATAVLALLAGAFIACGSIGFLVVQGIADASGPVQLLSGLTFSVGLVLVTITGAELFTGNSLMALPVADRKLAPGRLASAWAVVWLGNLVGSVAIAALFVAAGGGDGVDGLVGKAAVTVAAGKAGKAAPALVASGVLANLLVCLAVWTATGAATIGGKIAAIVGPVTLFVAAGFEHSIANMSLLPIGWMLDGEGTIPLSGIVRNLALSTLGNVVGGAGVGLLLRRGFAAGDTKSG